jgi:branched-chain amino acid transport system permease protein
MEATLNTILIFFIHGLVYGILMFLIASGLTIIFGMMGILNLAHASFYMFGAYFGAALLSWTNLFWLSLILAPLLTAAMGSLTERFLIRPIHSAGLIFELLLTIGLSLVMLEIVKWVWGTERQSMPVPDYLSGSVQILIFTYPAYRLFIFGFGLAVIIGLAIILTKTNLGMIVRAAISDAEMVSSLGIDTPLTFNLVFSLGTGLAGLAGVIAGPLFMVYPGMATAVGMSAFVVVAIGGLGSLKGAVLASFFIGQMQSFGVLLVPQFSLVLIFLLMAAVLIIRPQGLFGEKG